MGNGRSRDSRSISGRSVSGNARLVPADPINPGTGSKHEIDSMRASLHSAARSYNLGLPNSTMIELANSLNDKLFLPDSEVGPGEKSAIAETLILMHREMDRRIMAAAQKQRKALPHLPGVKWRKNDPLAGIVEAISPFHMVDWWNSFVKSKPKDEPQVTRWSFSDDIVTARVKKDRPKKPPEPKKPTQDPARIGDLGEEIRHRKQPKRIPPWVSPNPFGLLKSMAKELVKEVFLAIPKGMEEAAHDVSIYVLADGIASMAVAVGEKIGAAYPEPNCKGIQPILDGWIQRSHDRNKAKRVHRRAIRMGLKAAKGFIKRLDASGSRIHKEDRWGHRYLLWLRDEYKTRTAIYGKVLRELADRGIQPRAAR